MARTAIEFDNHRVQKLLSRYASAGLRKKHPEIDGIIRGTLDLKFPRKFSGDTLLHILKVCPVISTPAAADATGHRYAYSTLSEYAALARIASQAIAEHINQ